MSRVVLLFLLCLGACASPTTPAENPPAVALSDVGSSGASRLSGGDAVSELEPASARPGLVILADQPFPATVLEPPVGTDASVVRRAVIALHAEHPEEALKLLAGMDTGAAKLVQARAFRALGQFDAAEAALIVAREDAPLLSLVELESGQVAMARADLKSAESAWRLVMTGSDVSLKRRIVLAYAELLSHANPLELLTQAAGWESLLDVDDLDAKGRFLEAVAMAHVAAGQPFEAAELRLRRFLEEPVSLLTPEQPPKELPATPLQLLTRAELLLEKNRNERAVAALDALADGSLNQDERCRKLFALGLSKRKLHLYGGAEHYFTDVTKSCADPALVKRAMYLNAKVVSIAEGLQAVPIIESFAKRFAASSMVDDMLFWAGDLYQRRKRFAEAEGYFTRIENLPEKGDHCGEARWRLAWMSYRRGNLVEARERLLRLLERDGCVDNRFERARAHYWLGRLSVLAKQPTLAATHFQDAMVAEPLGYYAQLALTELFQTAPEVARRQVAELYVPQAGAWPLVCAGSLASEPEFMHALEWLRRGLTEDAALGLLALGAPNSKVVGVAQAQALGVETKGSALKDVAAHLPGTSCGANDPRLLLALLLDRAGAYGKAHWRLRTDFAEVLANAPTPATSAVWVAAYPLAFRDFVAAGEAEGGVPELFLQALCREESALDPQAVSWAGAYGLTQLLLASAKGAGRFLKPPVTVTRAEELLEPALSARLGGALLGSLLKRFAGHPGLALAGYNASESTADTWWSRHQGQRFDEFVEEITIKETRGYVARVLKTWGIYRFMYASQPPTLPVAETLPNKPGVHP